MCVRTISTCQSLSVPQDVRGPIAEGQVSYFGSVEGGGGVPGAGLPVG